jgi:hypothetical protein
MTTTSGSKRQQRRADQPGSPAHQSPRLVRSSRDDVNWRDGVTRDDRTDRRRDIPVQAHTNFWRLRVTLSPPTALRIDSVHPTISPMQRVAARNANDFDGDPLL